MLASLQFDRTTGRVGLSSDGLHAFGANSVGLAVWDRSGRLVASAAGDHSRARVFGSGDELRVGLSLSHQDAIEVFDLSSGDISVTPSFAGNFHSWFLDGDKFLTTISNVVWIYSRSVEQLEIISLPSTSNGRLGALLEFVSIPRIWPISIR